MTSGGAAAASAPSSAGGGGKVELSGKSENAERELLASLAPLGLSSLGEGDSSLSEDSGKVARRLQGILQSLVAKVPHPYSPVETPSLPDSCSRCCCYGFFLCWCCKPVVPTVVW